MCLSRDYYNLKMKPNQGHKDRRRNYGGPKRGVNYIPKYYKGYGRPYGREDNISKPIEPREKLTKSIMFSLYKKSPFPASCLESIKAIKDAYVEDSIEPEGVKDFSLPMNKAIMPPRKNNMYDTKEVRGHYQDNYQAEEDEGIVKGADNSHSNMSNAPLWFDNKDEITKDSSEKSNDMFTMEGMANKHISLEEEKARFNKESTKAGAKINPDSLFSNKEIEEEYSNVDIKYEKSLKDHKIQDLFANSIDNQSENSKAIDIGSIEANMIKGKKPEEVDNDDEEEMPIWDAFSAEEIKKGSQDDFGSWSQNLNQSTKQRENVSEMNQMYPPNNYPIKTEAMNPFCHSSLNIKEADRVWYYTDTQNVVQGPFSSIEMFTWYRSGFFPANLPIKCGRYSPFAPLGELLNSIKQRQEAELNRPPVQHFNNPGFGVLFDQSSTSMESNPTTPPLSVEQLESKFNSISGYSSVPPRQPYYEQCVEDPAIASIRIGEARGVELFPEKQYVKDEADDLKALLGMKKSTGPS